jgi:Zn-dependent protease
VTSLLFFVSILLHELGHSLVAQRLGVRVRSITLFVFGGIAQLESEPRRPRDEVWIASAGPVVSGALGALFYGLGALLGGATGAAEVGREALSWLGRINLTVAAFNLAPGFPLDGGRVLRGILWAATGSFARATAAAAGSGTLLAYALIALGALAALFGGQLVGGLWLVFIGWFLRRAARATVGQLVVERALAGVSLRQVLEPVSEARVPGSARVSELVADAVLRRGLRTFYVVDAQDRLLGLFTLGELAALPESERAQRRADEVMIPLRELAVIGAHEDGWTAFQRMAERNVNQLPVLADGRLAGAITRERLIALVHARLALGGDAAEIQAR